MTYRYTLISPREEGTECSSDSKDLDHMGLRIAAIFIILVSSLLGALLPVLLGKLSGSFNPKKFFFVFKFVGTGVIISTALMHLLSPAIDALHSECLADQLGDYDWAFFIALMTILLMLFIEMVANHFSDSIVRRMTGSAGHSHATTEAVPASLSDIEAVADKSSPDKQAATSAAPDLSYLPHSHGHGPHVKAHGATSSAEFAAQIIGILILEFGVIFHSVFIGLVLSTTDEVVVLTIVLVFHQLMEGLGVGSRLASIEWPTGRGWWPYLLALMYAISTPIGIAAGLGARPNNGNTQNLVNGIFDSISAGILLYTGLVELLAHEFMFNEEMNRSGFLRKFAAVVYVCIGAGIMALIANWA